jgi:hypothetical protein
MKPNIVVMNPPYVRQESIPEKSKSYYASRYKLDNKSDLFAYFIVRSLNLVSESGTVSVISSDKWLEAGYGTSLQSKIKGSILAIYGQRKGSFKADVHTVITILQNAKVGDLINFTYLDSYSNVEVRRSFVFKSQELKPGKWFYLRSPLIFVNKILPCLSHRLQEFANIRRGFTTGANEFFYLKNISHIFEADYLADPDRFRNLGVRVKTARELESQGLIYIENEAGERYVLNKSDVLPIVRSPRQLEGFSIASPTTLCLYTDKPGSVTRKYITHGEEIGIAKRPTLRAHKPWFKLADLTPSRILLLKSPLDMYYVPISDQELVCDQRLYLLHSDIMQKIWLYLNSTIGLLTIELFSRKGASSDRGAVLDIAVEDYEQLPVPDLRSLQVNFDPAVIRRRRPLKYSEEVHKDDRKELDKAVLQALGFTAPEEEFLSQIYEGYLETVEDRLTKHSVT